VPAITLDNQTTAPPIAAQQTQRHAALARANAIRLGRAALKRSIQAGHRHVVDVIADCPPEAASMPVVELLGAQHRWGETRALRLVRRAELPETKVVGQLTPRQRRALVGCLQQPNPGT
jgi:hypothetical protein